MMFDYDELYDIVMIAECSGPIFRRKGDASVPFCEPRKSLISLIEMGNGKKRTGQKHNFSMSSLKGVRILGLFTMFTGALMGACF